MDIDGYNKVPSTYKLHTKNFYNCLTYILLALPVRIFVLHGCRLEFEIHHCRVVFAFSIEPHKSMF
jgi:hypothetical protein